MSINLNDLELMSTIDRVKRLEKELDENKNIIEKLENDIIEKLENKVPLFGELEINLSTPGVKPITHDEFFPEYKKMYQFVFKTIFPDDGGNYSVTTNYVYFGVTFEGRYDYEMSTLFPIQLIKDPNYTALIYYDMENEQITLSTFTSYSPIIYFVPYSFGIWKEIIL